MKDLELDQIPPQIIFQIDNNLIFINKFFKIYYFYLI